MIYRENNKLDIELGNLLLDSLEDLTNKDVVVSIEKAEDGLTVEKLSGQILTIEIAKGDKGEQGEQGIEGPKGQDGEQGRDGLPGRDGKRGKIGPEGPRGEKGDQGERGEQGEGGPKGDQGARGERGEKGTDGKDGEDGTNGRDGQDGERGEKGEEGVGIIDVEVDRKNNLIVKTSDGKVYTNKIKVRSSGGVVIVDPTNPPDPTPPFTYTNNEPMPQALGGYPAGTTFNNVSLQELWTRLLYPQDPPIFTSFTIGDLTAGDQPNKVDLGYTISGDTAVNWTFNEPYEVLPDSVSLTFYPTSKVFFENQSVTGPQTIDVTPNIVVNEPGNVSFRIRAKGLDYSGIFKDLNMNYEARIYYGESSSLSFNTSGQVTSLRANELRDNVDGIYQFEPNNYKYICYPALFGLRTQFTDVDTNFAVAMQRVYDVTVTLPTGLAVLYHVYRTYNTLGAAINIEVSS